MDRGKDALAIRVDGDTPTPSGMFLSRKQELASAMLGINQTALLPRYGGDLETPRQRQHTTSFLKTRRFLAQFCAWNYTRRPWISGPNPSGLPEEPEQGEYLGVRETK